MLKVPLSVLLACLVVIISGCIVTARGPQVPHDSIPRVADVSHAKKSISFFYYTGSTGSAKADDDGPTRLPLEFGVLKAALGSTAWFDQVTIASSPPTTGTHVTSYLLRKDTTWTGTDLVCMLSYSTLTVIPCYKRLDYTVHYDVYLDNEVKRSYEYDLYLKAFSWLGLAPFAWINFFTASYQHAFEATALQFLVDAHRDGYL